jgi:hypothetical protein
MDKTTEQILRRRMHGLYLSRKCEDIRRLSRELLGLHCWFHRNVVFSALIRGADITGWKTALTKTWVHHALHGVVYEDLPSLLAVHARGAVGEPEFCGKVIRLMEDGVCSRAEMRRIFADEVEPWRLKMLLSPWGGVFVDLAREGRVAFRDMASRDFDLISAEPAQSFDEVLPGLLRRFFTAYGPATLADAAWFFGLRKEKKQRLFASNLDEYARFEQDERVYYYVNGDEKLGEIPALLLLSGFDPLIVSYADRGAVLPPEYKKSVILSSGICLPAIAVNGRVAGIWNIKKTGPAVTFFTPQPPEIQRGALDLADNIGARAANA